MIFKTWKLVFLFFISISPIEGQIELVDGIEWQYYAFNYLSGDVYEYKNWIEGDTIINNVGCKKFKREYLNCNDRKVIEEYIYQNDDKLYYYHFEDSTFQLLYDFNPNMSDTIKIRNWGHFANNESHFYLSILAVIPIDYNGVTVNEIFAQYGRDDGQGGIQFIPYYYRYVQGIGLHINFFYFHDTGWCDGLHVTELYCYYHPNYGNFILNPEKCDLLPVGIEAIENDFEVNVFPNPTSQIVNLKIESEVLENYKIQFYTSAGHQIYQEAYHHTNQIEIDISNFPKGFYHYVLINEKNQDMFFGKINLIKE